MAVHVGEAEAAASARIPVVDGLEANPFAHASEQSLELFGFKGLRQVADVEANAHGKKGEILSVLKVRENLWRQAIALVS